MNSFSVVFFLALFFLLLRSLSAVSNSFYLSVFPFFSHSFYATFNAIPQRNFDLPRLHFPFSICACALFANFSSPFFYMTSPRTHHQFFSRTFLHSSHHSRFIHFLLSALLTPIIILTRLLFANLDLLLLFLC